MKACKKALYSEIKERRQIGGEWLIGAHTKNIPYLSLVPTPDKTRQRRIRCLLMRVKAPRRESAY